MNLEEDKYLYALKIKLNFYKDLLHMIDNIKNMYDITFIESTIDFAFPGYKFDNELLKTLTEKINCLTEEVKVYYPKNESRLLNKEAQDINNFKMQLERQKNASENDYKTVNRMVQYGFNADQIDSFIDIRVRSIQENLKTENLNTKKEEKQVKIIKKKTKSRRRK